MNTDLKKQVISELRKRGYVNSTVSSYSSSLFKLFEYYPAIHPLEITNDQVTKYAKSLIARNKSRSTLSSLIYVSRMYFDEINNKNHGTYKFKLPPEKDRKTEFFTQTQILELIQSKKNIKHKCIISLMYSCGLEIGELLNLKVDNIRSRESFPNIQITDSSGKIKRKAYLSKRILSDLRAYYQEYKPENWFFYSQNDKNKPYSSESTRKMIKDSTSKLNFSPLLQTKSFKYSYIKHLNELGIPLIKILIHLGIENYDSHKQYSKLIHGEIEINFSPLDRRINEDIEVDNFNELEHLIFELDNINEIEYLMEGIDCFRNGALRAGIIFIWSAAMQNVRQKLINSTTLTEINKELILIDKGAKEIKNVDSFQFIKDETTLHLSQRVGLYDKFEKNELINSCLGLRNKCGHPSNYKPEIQKAKAFVEDILNMIYKKTLPNTS